MENSNRVVQVELLAGGLLIEFGDGKQALYTYALLGSVLDSAQLIVPDELGD